MLFAATNIDDIFVLLGFFSDPKFREHEIVLGQYAGIGVLVLVSIIAALVALVIPRWAVGLLGLAPIAIGIMKLSEPWRGKNKDEASSVHHSAGSQFGRIGAVATV